MKKIAACLTLAWALLIAPIMVFGQAGNQRGPAIAITPDDYNTGDISRLTRPFTQVFSVTNNGNALLSIAKIKYT
jgi:hypothetical protein